MGRLRTALTALALLGPLTLLAACGTPGLAPPTSTPPPTATPLPPATPTPSPTLVPTLAPTKVPTATTAPAATATRQAATAAAPTATTANAPAATKPATGSTPSGTATDQTGACQVALPAGFQKLADGVWYADDATLLLVATDTGGQDFATYTKSIPDQFANDSTIQGFTPGKVTAQPDRYRFDFTATATGNDPNPANGTLAAVPAGSTQVCIMEFFYHPQQQAKYAPVADQLVGSLQATKK